MMKRILVGTDGSAGADRAVQLAARLAAELEAHLKIVHVLTVDDPPLDELNDHASIARKRAEAVGLSDIESESLAGNDVAESILATAHRDEVGMIIVGKRGLGRVAGLLLGSVSQKLVSDAQCPVMVV